MSANDAARPVHAGSMAIPDFQPVPRTDPSRSTVPSHRLTDAEITRFGSDGFLLRKGIFAIDEIQPLIDVCNDPTIEAVTPADNRGRPQEVATWVWLGNDLCGVFPRVARMVEAAEAVLGL